MSAGWVNAINTREVMSSVIELSIMLGSHVFIGAGGGAFINRKFRAANVLYYEPSEWVVYTVGHNKVGQLDYGSSIVTNYETRPAGKYSYYGKRHTLTFTHTLSHSVTLTVTHTEHRSPPGHCFPPIHLTCPCGAV